MSIYKQYLSGEARDLAIEEATLENELMKLDTMYEMTVLQLEQMYRDAELKVLTESGTYDDLMYLYEQADAEVKPQQGNIFQKIIDAIMGILNSIGNAIKGIFSKGNPEDEVEVPKETVEAAKKSLGMFGNIKQGVERIKNKDFGGGLQILKAIALPTLAVGAVAGGTAVAVKMKKGELEGLAKKLGEMKNYFTDAIAKIKGFIGGIFNKNKGDKAEGGQEQKNNDEGIFKGVFDKLRGFASSIKKIIDSIFASVKKALPGAKGEDVTFTDDTEGGEKNNNIAKDPKKVKQAKKGKKGEKEPGLLDKAVNKGVEVVQDVAKIKDTAENIVSDAKDAIKGDQFATFKTASKKVWKVDKETGKVRLFDKKGKQIDYRPGAEPQKVKELVEQIKSSKQGTTNESSFDIDYSMFSDDDYLVESDDKYVIIRELEEVNMESTSIFGYDISNELLLQESDAFDDELSELIDLFGNL